MDENVWIPYSLRDVEEILKFTLLRECDCDIRGRSAPPSEGDVTTSTCRFSSPETNGEYIFGFFMGFYCGSTSLNCEVEDIMNIYATYNLAEFEVWCKEWEEENSANLKPVRVK